jgi:hypothetical protein
MRLGFGLALLLLATAACRGPEPEPDAPSRTVASPGLKPANVMVAEAFTVVTPPEFELSKPDKQMDFDVYEVRKGATPYVKVYVGNFPTFPTEGETRTEPSKPISRDSAKIVHPSGLTTEEFLLPTNKADWPRAIHAWALEVPGDQDTANRIAAAVKIRE